MRLKKNRQAGACDAARCEETEGLVGYAAGVTFAEKEGEVSLCERHVAQRDREREAAKDAPVKAALPNGDEGEGLQMILRQEAEEAKDVLVMVKKYAIAKQEDVDFANECLMEVKEKLRWIKEKREEATKPMNAALKAIRSWFKPAEEFYSECEDLWKEKIRDGLTALDAAQRRALAEASEAHQAGDLGQVTEAMAVASQATVELPANLSIIERWSYRIVDEALLPREYLTPDSQKILRVVMALGKDARIPGIEVFRDDVVSQRRQ